jgi:hypothetical protein
MHHLRVLGPLLIGVVLGGQSCTSDSRSRTAGGDVRTPPTVLFEEHYEDANLEARGWYDLGGTPSLSSTEHVAGSARSLQISFAKGGTSPSPSVAARHLFTPTTSVYVRYWVKYGSNWVGSNVPYHPHELNLLTTEDDKFVGPAYTFLTLYIETNFQSGQGTPVLASQDGKNVDVTRLRQDLTNLTEARAVSGCNGDPDGTAGGCYSSGNVWFNGRTWRAAEPTFLSTTGSGYKNDWHKVEAFYQLNTITNGKANRDGIAQFWFDGRLVIDRHDLYLRTGAHPNMQFNQLLFAPYIGDGSPVAQMAWIDDLSVQTARPANP